jgi:IS5 family transposase
MEEQLGMTINRIVADRGYRSQNAPSKHQFKVYIAGQKRLVTDSKRYNIQSRLAVEPVIGHVKDDHRRGRNCLADTAGDAIDAFSQLLAITSDAPSRQTEALVRLG